MRKGKEPSDHAPVWAEFDDVVERPMLNAKLRRDSELDVARDWTFDVER